MDEDPTLLPTIEDVTERPDAERLETSINEAARATAQRRVEVSSGSQGMIVSIIHAANPCSGHGDRTFHCRAWKVGLCVRVGSRRYFDFFTAERDNVTRLGIERPKRDQGKAGTAK